MTAIFDHPTIFDKDLCIDFLQEKVAEGIYSDGWVPVYTIQSILMQLESYFNEPINKNDRKKYRTEDDCREANAFKCDKCKHMGKIDHYPKMNT